MDDSFPTEHDTTESAVSTAPQVTGLAYLEPHGYSPTQACWTGVVAHRVVAVDALVGFCEATPQIFDMAADVDSRAAPPVRVPMGAGTACLACVLDSVAVHTCGGATDDWIISLLTY